MKNQWFLTPSQDARMPGLSDQESVSAISSALKRAAKIFTEEPAKAIFKTAKRGEALCGSLKVYQHESCFRYQNIS